MIESLQLADVATYGREGVSLHDLKRVNFFYGANGTGKTTLTRVLADPGQHPGCRVRWRQGEALECLVYNRDFVREHFSQTRLRGIFSLGEENIEAGRRIDAIRILLDQERNRSAAMEEQRQIRSVELAGHVDRFRERCWALIKTHAASFAPAFVGARNSKEKSLQRLLHESRTNTSSLLTRDALTERARIIFAPSRREVSPLPVFDMTAILAHERNPILQEIILGREDAPLAALMRTLGNSDWVRQGRRFHQVRPEQCPYCQQSAPSGLSRELDDCFDLSYEQEILALTALSTQYERDADALQGWLEALLASLSVELDMDVVQYLKYRLEQKLYQNRQRLAEKLQQPSRTVTLESLAQEAHQLSAMIRETNQRIAEQNRLVGNLAVEQGVLTGQVWKFLLAEIAPDLEAYQSHAREIERQLAGLEAQIGALNATMRTLEEEMTALAGQMTSIQPAIDGVNGLLSMIGFSGFTLSMAEGNEHYRVMRGNGQEVADTLSEGEKTLLTLLYFYFLVQGGPDPDSARRERIVVLDDPVSGLDNEAVRFSARVVRKLIALARQGPIIRQLWILTHDVLFFQEAIWNSQRVRREALPDESFWIVRKNLSGISSLERYPVNPVCSMYDLLWEELRSPERARVAGLLAAQRILESHFRHFGPVDLRGIQERFAGQEWTICAALLAGVREDSMHPRDAWSVPLDEESTQQMIKVFREIFEIAGHLGHYRQMMGVSG
ncbi:MAG: AAA family ATPase [Magnetococcales bacterium]|nr:AAA family ATPase [Magnetococcales bacterium]